MNDFTALYEKGSNAQWGQNFLAVTLMLINTSKEYIFNSSGTSGEWRMLLNKLREMKTLHEIQNLNSNS